MYKYKYVDVEADFNRWSGFRILDSCGNIIDEYASKGYRYVGQIPKHQSGNGAVMIITLIFEIEVN